MALPKSYTRRQVWAEGSELKLIWGASNWGAASKTQILASNLDSTQTQIKWDSQILDSNVWVSPQIKRLRQLKFGLKIKLKPRLWPASLLTLKLKLDSNPASNLDSNLASNSNSKSQTQTQIKWDFQSQTQIQFELPQKLKSGSQKSNQFELTPLWHYPAWVPWIFCHHSGMHRLFGSALGCGRSPWNTCKMLWRFVWK